MRSANAPAISAGVMMAKVSWKHDVDGLGYRRRQRIGIADALGDVAHDALQQGAVETPDERGSRPECQAVGEDQPENADETGDGEARHHGVAHVLLAHHAAVEQAEPRDRHQQHQRHRGQHPGGVAGIGRAVLEHRQFRIRIAGAGRRCRVSRRGRRGRLLGIGVLDRRHAQKERDENPEGESHESRTAWFLERHGSNSCR